MTTTADAGNVLHAEERRVVPSRAQRVEQMLAVIVEGKATMRQPQHATAMRRLASDQGGPTGRACGRSAEGLPKQHALIGQLLETWRGNWCAIRLDRAACIMRMQVQNIGSGHSAPLQIADCRLQIETYSRVFAQFADSLLAL